MELVSSRFGQNEVASVRSLPMLPQPQLTCVATSSTHFPTVSDTLIAPRVFMASGAVCITQKIWGAPLTCPTGVWSPLASITLVRTVSFSIYQRSKYAIDDWIYQATGSSPLVIANTRGAYPTLSTIACFGLAGAGAGATITAIACTLYVYSH
jgi:hypothetical protein